MSGYYFDEHMDRAIAKALMQKGILVIMAVDVGMRGKDDDTEHLPYAAANDLVLVTFDHPFAHRAMTIPAHPGMICFSHKLQKDTGKVIAILAEFAQLHDPTRDAGQVFWYR